MVCGGAMEEGPDELYEDPDGLELPEPFKSIGGPPAPAPIAPRGGGPPPRGRRLATPHLLPPSSPCPYSPHTPGALTEFGLARRR